MGECSSNAFSYEENDQSGEKMECLFSKMAMEFIASRAVWNSSLMMSLAYLRVD